MISKTSKEQRNASKRIVQLGEVILVPAVIAVPVFFVVGRLKDPRTGQSKLK